MKGPGKGDSWKDAGWRDTKKDPPNRRRDGKYVLAIGRDEEGVYMVVLLACIAAEQWAVYPCWRQLPPFPPGMQHFTGAPDFSVAAGLIEED